MSLAEIESVLRQCLARARVVLTGPERETPVEHIQHLLDEVTAEQRDLTYFIKALEAIEEQLGA